jgi:hypothetical protein
MGRGEVRTGCRWGKLRETEHLKELGLVAGRIILKWILKG